MDFLNSPVMANWHDEIGNRTGSILEKVGKTRQCLNDFLMPESLLLPRANVNSLQVENQRFDQIKSISIPAAKKNFSLQLLLRETADQRSLAHHQKYQRVWDKHDERMDKHFKNKEAILTGKSVH